jgi:hypothetical protein
MSEMPTCSKCGQPHWRFSACEDAPALAAKEVADARERERLKVKPELSTPPGMVRVGPNKFARDTGARPTYVQIAPGKYRKAR